jgi:hypothetical protein
MPLVGNLPALKPTEFGPLNLLPHVGGCLSGPGKKVERHRATYSRKGGVRHLLAAKVSARSRQ